MFSSTGGVSFLVFDADCGTAVVIDPEAGKWDRYQRRAEAEGCTIQVALCTGASTTDVPVTTVRPVGVEGGSVQVQLGTKRSALPLGMSEAFVRLRGILIGVAVIGTQDDGELAYVLPDGGAIVSGRRLSTSDDAEPVPIVEMIPDWTLGIFKEGTVYSTRAPDGVYRRPTHDERKLRDLTRSRILRRLAGVGGVDQRAVAQALGM